MLRPPRVRRLLLPLALVLALGMPLPTLAQVPANEAVLVLTPDAAPRVAALLRDPPFDTPQPDGYVLDGVRAQLDQVDITLSRAGQPVGRLHLTPRARAAAGATLSASFAIATEPLDTAAATAALLARAVRSLVANDQGGFYLTAQRAPNQQIMHPGEAWTQQPDAPLRDAKLAFGALGLWFVALLVRARGRLSAYAISGAVRLNHVIPASLQIVLLSYWAWYWPPARHHMLFDVPLQLAFTLLFEAAWCLTYYRRWEANFGIFPIVFSTNLFIWFPLNGMLTGFAVMALAVLSKSLIRRRDGTHVFNPSAFGVAVIGVLVIARTGLHYTDITRELALAPNMWELMFLLTLLPLLRFGVVQMSLFAVCAMLTVHAVMPGDLRLPVAFWPPWFLSMTLFAGDPMSIPRTFVGRALFGVCLGVGIPFFAWLLVQLTGVDYFAKIFPVVACNLATPLFDRIGLRADRWLTGLPLAKPDHFGEKNLVMRLAPALVWLPLLISLRTAQVKSSMFDGAFQTQAQTSFVVHATDAAAECADNPVWCQPFSFAAEWAMWRGGMERR